MSVPAQRRRWVVAVANQKGGVAKTTTVGSLGAALAELGQRVLLVDLDPQACLTFSLGHDPETIDRSVHQVLLGEVAAAEVIIPAEDGVDLLPATIELATAEQRLLMRTGREQLLKTALTRELKRYDVILLDCPPSLGILTTLALTAARGVIIPLQCETLSHRGVGQLLDTVYDVKRMTNRRLVVVGVLPTLFDARTTSRSVGPPADRLRLRGAGAGSADPEIDPIRRGPGARPLGADDGPPLERCGCLSRCGGKAVGSPSVNL